MKNGSACHGFAKSLEGSIGIFPAIVTLELLYLSFKLCGYIVIEMGEGGKDLSFVRKRICP